jgi:hypothetical protein
MPVRKATQTNLFARFERVILREVTVGAQAASSR